MLRYEWSTNADSTEAITCAICHQSSSPRKGMVMPQNDGLFRHNGCAKRWTLAEIKAANERAGFYFFSRQTMKFFGDTMRSFAVRHIDGKVYIQRVRRPKNAPQGYQWAGELREFHPDTGDIDIARND